MAKVTFRRGLSTLYKERWDEYNKHGNNDFSYLANSLYFATDTHQIYLDGISYTFDSNVDLTNILTDVDFDAINQTLTIDYSDEDKPSKTVYLTKFELKDENGPLVMDTVTNEETGQLIYQISMKDISEMDLKDVTSNYETNNSIIENGDTISVAFSKINDSLGWIDVPDDEDELSEETT